MEPINMILVLVVSVLLLAILIFIIWEMIFSVKYVRTAALVIVKLIERTSFIGSLIGGALEGLVKTFIWF
jgi:hypothetical protein